MTPTRDDGGARAVNTRGILREVVIVVAGIVIAFSLQAYWDGRGERVAERQLIAALDHELVVNLGELRSAVEIAAASLAAAESLLALTGPNATLTSPRDVDSLLMAAMPTSSFDPSTGTIEQILRLDGLRLISDEPLRRELAAWDEQLRDYREDELRVVEWLFRDLLPLIRGRLPGVGLQEQAAWVNSGSDMDRQELVRDLRFANVLGKGS